MPKNSSAYLLCVRVADEPHPKITTVQQQPCGDCGQPVWVTTASYDAAKQVGSGNVKPICTHCLPNAQSKGRLATVHAPTPAQLAEIPQPYRPGVIALTRQLFGKKPQH